MGQLKDVANMRRSFSLLLLTPYRIRRPFTFVSAGINARETPRDKTCASGLCSNISNTSDSVSSGYPNIERRVEDTTHSGAFLTKFEVFG